jgi:hypothetical protein
MSDILFSAGWVIAWLLTAILLVWHLPFYPFGTRVVSASGSALVILLVMASRWLLVGGLVVMTALHWSARRRVAAASRNLLCHVALIAHALAGMANCLIWVYGVYDLHRFRLPVAWALAVSYFVIPAVELTVLGLLRLSGPRLVRGQRGFTPRMPGDS